MGTIRGIEDALVARNVRTPSHSSIMTLNKQTNEPHWSGRAMNGLQICIITAVRWTKLRHNRPEMQMRPF